MGTSTAGLSSLSPLTIRTIIRRTCGGIFSAIFGWRTIDNSLHCHVESLLLAHFGEQHIWILQSFCTLRFLLRFFMVVWTGSRGRRRGCFQTGMHFVAFLGLWCVCVCTSTLAPWPVLSCKGGLPLSVCTRSGLLSSLPYTLAFWISSSGTAFFFQGLCAQRHRGFLYKDMM